MGSRYHHWIRAHVLLAIAPPLDVDPLDVLRAGVASYDLDVLLRKLATISGRIVDASGKAQDGPDFHLSLAEELCDGRMDLSEIRPRIESGEITALTDPNQLASLGLFAVSNRHWPGIAKPISTIGMLGLFNYILLGNPQTNRFYVDPDSVEGTIGISTSHVERAVNVWYRYLRFYRWSVANTGIAGVDVPGSILRGTGMTFEDYARCAIALSEYYGSRSATVNGTPSLDASQVSDAGAALHVWLRSRSMTPEYVDSLLKTNPLETLRDKGFFEVLSRPIMAVNRRYFLLNPRALDNALGLGVFFAALDAGNVPQDFFAYAGLFFESYVGELLQGICARSGAAYHPEVVDSDGLKSTDHFVLEGNHLVFVEARFGKINRQVVQSLSAEQLDRAFEELIYAKAEQLDRNIRKFIDGRLKVPGVERGTVDRCYPLIALPHTVPRSPKIQARIDSTLVDRGLLPTSIDGLSVAPLEIVEAESLEGLEGVNSAVSLSSIIDRKVADPRTRFTFFKNFLVDGMGFELRMSTRRQEEVADFQRRLRDDTGGWIV